MQCLWAQSISNLWSIIMNRISQEYIFRILFIMVPSFDFLILSTSPTILKHSSIDLDVKWLVRIVSLGSRGGYLLAFVVRLHEDTSKVFSTSTIPFRTYTLCSSLVVSCQQLFMYACMIIQHQSQK